MNKLKIGLASMAFSLGSCVYNEKASQDLFYVPRGQVVGQELYGRNFIIIDSNGDNYPEGIDFLVSKDPPVWKELDRDSNRRLFEIGAYLLREGYSNAYFDNLRDFQNQISAIEIK